MKRLHTRTIRFLLFFSLGFEDEVYSPAVLCSTRLPFVLASLDSALDARFRSHRPHGFADHLSYRLTEVAHSDRPELFVRKLNQCSVVFDFNDASSELKGKQIKAAALHDMLEYITTQRGVITENVYPEVVKMVRICSRVFYV